MHCLLCHEKIPRFRHWRTKSEFCCDEHAAVHRRQTLERLVGSVSEPDSNPVDPEARIAALVERSSASRQSAETFDPRLESSQDAPESTESALAGPMQDAAEEAAWDESWRAGEERPEASAQEIIAREIMARGTSTQEPTWQQIPAQEDIDPETGFADRQPESAEFAEVAGEQDFLEEQASVEGDLAGEDVTEEAGDEDAAYFEGTRVQHDEPFPVDIVPIESRDSGPSGPDLSEPLEPAFEGATPGDLTELSPVESSFGSRAEAELSAVEETASDETEREETASEETGSGDSMPAEPQAVAQDTEPEAISETADTELAETEVSTEAVAAGPVPDGLDLSLFDDELSQEPAVLEAAAELAELAGELVESAGEAEAAALEADTSPAAAGTAEPQAEASASSQQAAPSVASGSEPQPKKALDTTRPRGKKKSSGRSGAGSEESLNRLAGQLQDRDSKLRAMGPGSEARRESKSKLVCFLPVQGGNGSSTVSLHVAEAISHHLNKRVLLTDFDFHSGTLAFRLGLKPEHTFVDVFKWEQPENGSWDSVVCPWKQLDVLVAPPSNTSIHPQSMDRLPDILMSALRRYPYVIVDHPDAIYSSSRHILAMSDLVYLVCTPEITSLHLARRKVQQIRAMGVPGERLRLIVNRTGSWGSLGLEDVGKIVGVPVSWALMNDYAALRDAVWNGGLVQEGSALARQLRELGWSIMGVDAQVAEESAAPVDVASRV